MYHRVADVAIDSWGLCVSATNFEAQMRIIKKYAQPLSFEKVAQCPKRIFGKRVNVSLTFDDGYSDNYHSARPILEKHETPATFFIVSGMVGQRAEFWWDELERIVLSGKPLPEVFDLTLAGRHLKWRLNGDRTIPPNCYEKAAETIPVENTVLSDLQFFYALWSALVDLPLGEKQNCLKKLIEWRGNVSAPRQNFFPMKHEEVKALSNSQLFEIGAHTVTHPRLSKLPVEKQEDEIGQSKKSLEDILDKPVTSFSYPHGDYSPDTVKVMQRLNIHNACTVSQRRVEPDAELLRLPRFWVGNWPAEEFEKKLLTWINHE
jgi:peptidoglycan/xylan/chitin deacetylase (PgdA/CDA1 family)